MEIAPPRLTWNYKEANHDECFGYVTRTCRHILLHNLTSSTALSVRVINGRDSTDNICQKKAIIGHLTWIFLHFVIAWINTRLKKEEKPFRQVGQAFTEVACTSGRMIHPGVHGRMNPQIQDYDQILPQCFLISFLTTGIKDRITTIIYITQYSPFSHST